MSVKRARRWLGENNHLVQAWIWLGLGIPTVIWWKESVLWVALMSIYANAESSLSAHNAKKEQGDDLGKEGEC